MPEAAKLIHFYTYTHSPVNKFMSYAQKNTVRDPSWTYIKNVYKPATLECEWKTVAQRSSLAFIAHDSWCVWSGAYWQGPQYGWVFLGPIDKRSQNKSEFFSRPSWLCLFYHSGYHSARCPEIGKTKKSNIEEAESVVKKKKKKTANKLKSAS